MSTQTNLTDTQLIFIATPDPPTTLSVPTKTVDTYILGSTDAIAYEPKTATDLGLTPTLGVDLYWSVNPTYPQSPNLASPQEYNPLITPAVVTLTRLILNANFTFNSVTGQITYVGINPITVQVVTTLRCGRQANLRILNCQYELRKTTAGPVTTTEGLDGPVAINRLRNTNGTGGGTLFTIASTVSLVQNDILECVLSLLSDSGSGNRRICFSSELINISI